MKDYRILRAIGYAIYALGGVFVFLNVGFTAAALGAEGLPPQLAWPIALFMGAMALGIGAFLGSPDTWGQLWFQFVGTAAAAGKSGDRSAPRSVTAALMGLIIFALLAVLVLCYWGDWQTTYQAMASFGEGPFTLLATVLLIAGPETSLVIAAGVLQRAKEMELPALTAAASLDPAIAYAKASRSAAMKAAQQSAAATAGQYQHR